MGNKAFMTSYERAKIIGTRLQLMTRFPTFLQSLSSFENMNRLGRATHAPRRIWTLAGFSLELERRKHFLYYNTCMGHAFVLSLFLFYLSLARNSKIWNISWFELAIKTFCNCRSSTNSWLLTYHCNILLYLCSLNFAFVILVFQIYPMCSLLSRKTSISLITQAILDGKSRQTQILAAKLAIIMWHIKPTIYLSSV